MAITAAITVPGSATGAGRRAGQRGRRRHARRDRRGNDGRGIVAGAALLRRRHELSGGVAGILVDESATHVAVVEDVIETIAAEQQPVTGEEGQLEDGRQFALQPRMRADDVGEHVPTRIAPRRLGGDAALGNLVGHDRVVPRHLRQRITAQKVGAAVADMSDRGVLAMEQRRCQRRPHAGVCWLVLTGLEHRLVRAAVRLLQRQSQVAVRKRRKRLDERVHRDLAGDISRGMPTHAVGHDQEEVFTGARMAAADGQRRRHILVLVSPSGVCHRGDGQSQRLLGRINGSR